MRTGYEVTLSAAQNPDFERRYDLPKKTVVRVSTLEDASRECQRFIDTYQLGSGNWTGGQVRDAATGKIVARVSYNGRIWAPDSSEIVNATKENSHA